MRGGGQSQVGLRAAVRGKHPSLVRVATLGNTLSTANGPTTTKMRAWRVTAALTLLTLAAARRTDADFEFDDDTDARGPGGRSSGPRRYIYDPHNPLCATLTCGSREVCVLREGRALCADKRDILRRGDTLVASSVRDDDEDVFYDEPEPEPVDKVESNDTPDVLDDGADNRVDRCVGCGGAARGAFLCGSDNRTYSSLCRLDLHNCVRRPAQPVSMACRGFCPCPARHKPEAPLYQREKVHGDYDEEQDKHDISSHNEVWPHQSRRGSRRRNKAGKEACAMEKLADRLLDWFSVLMDDARATPPSRQGFPRDCKPEVRWMFNHLDIDGDGLLSAHNLYALRHDEREQCLRPFLSSCGAGAGAGGGAGGGLSRAAWCGCMRRAARPCTALRRAHPLPRNGAYVPACDSRGFYRPRQCHPALGVCWCVTLHGQERPGSRTKGAPACPGEKPSRSHSSAEAAGGGGAPADDEDADPDVDAGSGAGAADVELRF